MITFLIPILASSKNKLRPESDSEGRYDWIPSNFHIINIFNGLFWYYLFFFYFLYSIIYFLFNRFILPVSLIICNDITAYIWGFFFGRTSLIKLSPKKTWEGFIGAFISTVIFAYFVRISF